MKTISRELISAIATPLILSVLKKSDTYGYDIIQLVKDFTDGEVVWQEASIYPLLKKLEKRGFIKSYWRVNKIERPRKYYTILKDGKKQLELNIDEWQRLNKVLQTLWNQEI